MLQKQAYNDYRREWRRDQRIKLMMLLGGLRCGQCRCKACKCLDCRYYETLQLHHLNGDGEQDRARFNNDYDALISYYLKHVDEAREKLEVLCWFCNNKIENKMLGR